MAKHDKGIRRIVDQAAGRHRLVRIDRGIRGVDPVAGVPVGIGIRWIVVHQLSPDLDLDGYVAVRWKHVKRVRPFDDDDDVAARSIAGIDPAASSSALDPTTTGTVLRTAAASFGVIGFAIEKVDPSTHWIGTVRGVEGKVLELLPIGTAGHQSSHAVTVPFEAITRLEVGTRFQQGLARAAGVKTAASDAT